MDLSRNYFIKSYNIYRDIKAMPILSICIPFFNYDVTQLLQEIYAQSLTIKDKVEVLLLDDGSESGDQVKLLGNIASVSSISTYLIRSEKNYGRSIARNELVAHSHGKYILFLDSDMLPDSSDFIMRYIVLAEGCTESIVIGGRSYKRINNKNIRINQRLYLYHSLKTECHPAAIRNKSPMRYVFTNNIMIPRSCIVNVPMYDGFSGWGYEDIDWALHLDNQGVAVTHIDNTASHFGLIEDAELIFKYKSSKDNFCKMIERNQEKSLSLPICKVSIYLSNISFSLRFAEIFFKKIVLKNFLPLPLRAAALQGYKICIYSQSIKETKRN